MVKHIHISLDDDKHEKLSKKKGKDSWYNFLIVPRLKEIGEKDAKKG